jgi:hypothetical protein
MYQLASRYFYMGYSSMNKWGTSLDLYPCSFNSSHSKATPRLLHLCLFLFGNMGCNIFLVTTTTLITGAIFFFFFCLRCVRACRSNNTPICTTPLDYQQDTTMTRKNWRHTTSNCNIKCHTVLCTIRTQMEESIVVDFTIYAHKIRAFNLSFLLRRERRSDRLLVVFSGRNY